MGIVSVENWQVGSLNYFLYLHTNFRLIYTLKIIIIKKTALEEEIGQPALLQMMGGKDGNLMFSPSVTWMMFWAICSCETCTFFYV